MSKVFVIPDVHLKPWIFDKAEELLSQNEYDKIVCLGDLVDDGDQEKNLGLYGEIFDVVEEFIERHPNFLLCYGNHDVSYIWEARESGYSEYARPQDGRIEMYPKGYLQVVGHTPVRKTDYYGELVTVDNFSTYRNGNPIGDQRFIWVDTVTKQWGFADGIGEPEKQSDPKLDIRNYVVGDHVKFKIRYHGSDKDEILDGTVEIIDHYSGGYASIDVMSGDTLYKHLSLTDVLEHNQD